MSDYNSTDKTSAITVTKIVSPGVLPPVTTPTEIPLDAKNEVVVLSVSLLALDSILMSKMKVSVTGMNPEGLCHCLLYFLRAKTMFSLFYF